MCWLSRVGAGVLVVLIGLASTLAGPWGLQEHRFLFIFMSRGFVRSLNVLWYYGQLVYNASHH